MLFRWLDNARRPDGLLAIEDLAICEGVDKARELVENGREQVEAVYKSFGRDVSQSCCEDLDFGADEFVFVA